MLFQTYTFQTSVAFMMDSCCTLLHLSAPKRESAASKGKLFPLPYSPYTTVVGTRLYFSKRRWWCMAFNVLPRKIEIKSINQVTVPYIPEYPSNCKQIREALLSGKHDATLLPFSANFLFQQYQFGPLWVFHCSKPVSGPVHSKQY